MDLPPDFRELLAEFARYGVEAVLVGGYARASEAFAGQATGVQIADYH